MNKHGGSRKGSGKKPEFAKPMKRVNIMLDPETIAFYKTYGKSLSEGIRKYWRRDKALPPEVYEKFEQGQPFTDEK